MTSTTEKMTAEELDKRPIWPVLCDGCASVMLFIPKTKELRMATPEEFEALCSSPIGPSLKALRTQYLMRMATRRQQSKVHQN